MINPLSLLRSPLNTSGTLTAGIGGGGVGTAGGEAAGGSGPGAWGVAEIGAGVVMIINSSLRQGAQSVTIVTCWLYRRLVSRTKRVEVIVFL